MNECFKNAQTQFKVKSIRRTLLLLEDKPIKRKVSPRKDEFVCDMLDKRLKLDKKKY